MCRTASLSAALWLDYWPEGHRSDCLQEKRIFSSPPRPDRTWVLPNFVNNWTILSRVKRSEREANYSRSCSVDVTNVWIYASAPLQFFIACRLVSNWAPALNWHVCSVLSFVTLALEFRYRPQYVSLYYVFQVFPFSQSARSKINRIACWAGST